MRLVIAAVALVLGASTPEPLGATAPAATSNSPSASVGSGYSAVPSSSVERSGPLLPHAVVEIEIGSETEPVRDWTIVVSGGSPSEDALTVPDPVYGAAVFAVSISDEPTRVELTATLPTGSHLSAGSCTSDDEPVDDDVLVEPRQLVFEVVSGIRYRCSYGSTSDRPEFGAEIVANVVIDADGNQTTVDDQMAAEGWTFELELADGTIDEGSSTTSSSGSAGWLISYGSGGTKATVTEVVLEGFDLLDAFCLRFTDDGDEEVGEFDGTSITFEVDEGAFATYRCSFINIPSGTLLAGLSVWSRIDRDGDSDTVDDQEWARSSEFEAVFEDDVEVLFADPVTDRDEPAGWVIRFTGDLTRVVLTAVPRNGSRLLTASCFDADSSDGMEIPTTLADDSLTFAVNGFAPILELGSHPYSCTFLSSLSGGRPTSSVPPTHVSSQSPPREPAPRHLVLIGLAALVMALLVRRPRPRPMPARETRADTSSRDVDGSS